MIITHPTTTRQHHRISYRRGRVNHRIDCGGSPRTLSFADFARRAERGERLSVVFMGGSVTWGSQASDPNTTSYRALLGERLRLSYPRATFSLWDAAIGGTGSQVGVFRVERDVLSHRPNLVFLDFTLNDDLRTADEETLSSYEAVIRRILESGALIVQVLLPTRESVDPSNEAPRRTAHIALSDHYSTGLADVIEAVRTQIREGCVTTDEIWPKPDDIAHPRDAGYDLFATAIWDSLQAAIDRQTVSRIRECMIHADTYLSVTRNRLAGMGNVPHGWRCGAPSPHSPWGDFVMSRWFDQELIAGPITESTDQPADLRIEFGGSRVLLFAESTPRSGRYLVRIDGGRPIEHDAGELARRLGGNGHHFALLAEGLNAETPHVLEITPLLQGGEELRFESICIAGRRGPRDNDRRI